MRDIASGFLTTLIPAVALLALNGQVNPKAAPAEAHTLPPVAVDPGSVTDWHINLDGGPRAEKPKPKPKPKAVATLAALSGCFCGCEITGECSCVRTPAKAEPAKAPEPAGEWRPLSTHPGLEGFGMIDPAGYLHTTKWRITGSTEEHDGRAPDPVVSPITSFQAAANCPTGSCGQQSFGWLGGGFR